MRVAHKTARLKNRHHRTGFGHHAQGGRGVVGEAIGGHKALNGVAVVVDREHRRNGGQGVDDDSPGEGQVVGHHQRGHGVTGQVSGHARARTERETVHGQIGRVLPFCHGVVARQTGALRIGGQQHSGPGVEGDLNLRTGPHGFAGDRRQVDDRARFVGTVDGGGFEGQHRRGDVFEHQLGRAGVLTGVARQIGDHHLDLVGLVHGQRWQLQVPCGHACVGRQGHAIALNAFVADAIDLDHKGFARAQGDPAGDHRCGDVGGKCLQRGLQRGHGVDDEGVGDGRPSAVVACFVGGHCKEAVAAIGQTDVQRHLKLPRRGGLDRQAHKHGG